MGMNYIFKIIYIVSFVTVAVYISNLPFLDNRSGRSAHIKAYLLGV